MFIPFTKGSDERSNDFAQDLAQPIRLITDAEYRYERGLSKRYGFDKLESVFSSHALAGGTLLGNGRNYGVLRPWDFLPGHFAGVIPASDNRVQVANHFRTERVAEVTDSSSQTTPTLAVGRVGSILYACVVASRSSSTEAAVSIIEVDTGVVRLREVIAGHTLTQVTWVGDRFHVFALDTTGGDAGTIDLYVYEIDSAGEVERTDLTAYGSAVATGSTYDVCASGTTSLLALRDNATNDLVVKRFNAAGTETQSISQAVTGAAPQQVQVLTDDAGAVHVVHCSQVLTNTAYLETFTSTLSARTLGSTAVFTAVLDQVSVWAVNLTGSATLALVSHAQAGGVGHKIRHTQIDTDHTDLASVVTISSGHLLSKPTAVQYGSAVARPFIALKVANGDVERNFFPTALLAQLPRGTGVTTDGYTATSSGIEWSATLNNDADASVYGTGSAWGVDSTTGDQYVALTNVVSYNGTVSGVVVELSSVVVVRLGTAVSGASSLRTALPKVVFGETSYVGGGLLRFFDGVNFGEVVPMAPTNVALAQGSGSNLAAGTYAYCAVLCWEDAQGRLHRSAPSPVATRAHSGTNGIVATLRAHFATMLDLDVGGQQWTAELYRTEAGGSTFYLQQSKAIAPNTDTAFAEDVTTDASLATHRLLYTTGGVLQNEPPPPPAALCTHQGRLWGISAQDPHVLFCSKVAEERVAPEFNAVLQVRLDDPAVALASTDDKLVAFTANDAWYIVGEGPDNTNAGTFNPPERVAGSAGATGPKAAAAFPGGILVHTQAGFQLMGRDLSFADADYLPVNFSGARDIGATLHLPAKRQVWFMAEGGSASIEWAVYDYSQEQLRVSLFRLRSTAVNRLMDFQLVSGQAHVLGIDSADGSGDVFRQSTTSFADDGVFIPWSVELGWFMPDNLAGDCRFRKLAIHGRTPSGGGDCALAAAVSVMRPHDSNTSPVDTHNWAALESPGAPLFYRRATISRQNGSGCKVALSFASSGTANVEGPTLHGIDIDHAVRDRHLRQGGTKAPT